MNVAQLVCSSGRGWKSSCVQPLNSAMFYTKLVHLVIFKLSPVHGSIETWLSPLGTMLIHRMGERFVIWLITGVHVEYENKGAREFLLHLNKMYLACSPFSSDPFLCYCHWFTL